MSLKSYIIYSRDQQWIQRCTGLLYGNGIPQVIESETDLRALLKGNQRIPVWIDLRNTQALTICAEAQNKQQRALYIAFGLPESELYRLAETMPLFAVSPLDSSESQLRLLFKLVYQHIQLLDEMEALEARHLQKEQTHAAIVQSTSSMLELRHFSKAIRGMPNTRETLQRLLEGLESSVQASGLAAYMRHANGTAFVLENNIRLVVHHLFQSIDAHHPLTEELQRKPYIHIRQENVIPENAVQEFLLQTGADLLLPLVAHQKLCGWILIGPRFTGSSYTTSDIESLAVMLEHFSTLLENTLLYQEIDRERTLAQTLIEHMPFGVMASDAEGKLNWINQAAQRMLRNNKNNQEPITLKMLPGPLLNAMEKALQNQQSCTMAPEDIPGTLLPIMAHILPMNKTGLLVILEDQTLRREKESLIADREKQQLFVELAAALSHEIRNPLVAIKTFAQLLPAKYDDASFREKFSDLVERETNRLNNIIDLINEVAHPVRIKKEPVILQDLLFAAWKPFKKQLPHALSTLPENPIALHADAMFLSEALKEIIQNSLEASQEKELQAKVTIQCYLLDEDKQLQIVIEDHGSGFPPENIDRLFSPFYTSKASGFGLGLPKAKRIIEAHEGDIQLHSLPKGTCTFITLPWDPKK